MSELISTQSSDGNVRHHLLTNVSVLALLGVVCMPALAAPDETRPTVWIDLGGQLERVDGEHAVFTPPFFNLAAPSVLAPMVDAQRPSRYSTGAEGKVAILPAGTGLVFSAALRYGRVSNKRHLHYETSGLPAPTGIQNGNPIAPVKPSKKAFGDGETNLSESHLLLDFQAGKDVGLGMFGMQGSSVVSAGVRYAQFSSEAHDTLYARPVYYFGPLVPLGNSSRHHAFRQTYTAVVHAHRNSHGIGPSASWNASMPIIGREDGARIAFDWGVNASVLFGRQSVQEDHATTGYHLTFSSGTNHTFRSAHATAHKRSRAVTIPNVGGFAGLSLKFANAKISLGYRGDFFFGASDIGFDAADRQNTSFQGPFATISIGLGG